MLLRILLTYWGRRLNILKIVMLLKTKLTQQDIKNFRIKNRLGRVFFLIILKRLDHPSQVYSIIHLLPSNTPSIGAPKVSLHQMTLIHLLGLSSASNISSESNSRSVSNDSLIFVIDGNSQKLITSNDTRLTIAIADLILSEGLPYNLSQKPRFNKVLELSGNVLKTYIPPNIKLVNKKLLDVIHEQNIKSNLAMIKKEADIFGLLFLGDGDTISRCPLLNILASAK